MTHVYRDRVQSSTVVPIDDKMRSSGGVESGGNGSSVATCEMTMNCSPLLAVKAIDHITLVAKDLDRSAAFYVGVLGMRAVERPAFDFPGRWFQAGATLIHLNQEGPEAGAAGLARSAGTKASRGFHFAFEVDDCDRAAERLREHGIEIAIGPRDRPDGARQLYLRDPDGHLLELFSTPVQGGE